MVNVQVVRRWLSELSRGSYKQGFSSLRTDDSFCAWGVLCDLHRKEFGGDWVQFDELEGRKRMEYLGSAATPAEPVFEWAGINPCYCVNVFCFNDRDKKPFSEIAKEVKKELLPWDYKADLVCYGIYESFGRYPAGGSMQDFLTKVGGWLADEGVRDLFEQQRTRSWKPFSEDTEKQMTRFLDRLIAEKAKVSFGYCEWHELNRLIKIIDE